VEKENEGKTTVAGKEYSMTETRNSKR